MEKLVSKLVGLGVPGLVLLVAIAANGLAGGAAVVAALAVLGGPFGLLGGLGLLGLVALVSDTLADYSLQAIFRRVVEGLRSNGYSKRKIRRKIDKYPISSSLKKKLRKHLKKV